MIWVEDAADTSTDSMTLEWSFMPSPGSDPTLRVAPQWSESLPSISVAFEAAITARPGPFGLEAILPPGWGWSSLQIRADGLFSWRSADGQSLGALVSATASARDDGLPSDAYSSTQPPIALAPLDAGDDFSFEQSSFLDGPRASQTPTRRSLSGDRGAGAVLRVVPRSPTPAALFECEFEPSEGNEDEDRVILLEGTLQPMPLTLVSPDTPVQIPFFRFNDASLPLYAKVSCPGAAFVEREGDEDDDAPGNSHTCDTTTDSVGTFVWTDLLGQPLPPREAAPVTGDVRVIAQRSVWGVQTISCKIPWPTRSEEVALFFPAGPARVTRAHARGQPLAHSAIEQEGGTEIRLRGGSGQVDAVFEVVTDQGVAIPSFPNATGNVEVELVGTGWDSKCTADTLTPELLLGKPETTLTQSENRVFTGPAASPAVIRFSEPTAAPLTQTRRPSFARRLVSWNTLFHLVLLWVIVSLAQQVQRLRSEVAFVADEARDLRLYGFERASPLHDSEPDAWDQSASASSSPSAGKVQDPDFEEFVSTTTEVEVAAANYDIGRVVFGRPGWQWLQHPT